MDSQSEEPTFEGHAKVIREYHQALKERDKQKQAVLDWVAEQTQQMRLVRYGDAPSWYEYEKAEAAMLHLADPAKTAALAIMLEQFTKRD